MYVMRAITHVKVSCHVIRPGSHASHAEDPY
jgi:hypothetical protein